MSGSITSTTRHRYRVSRLRRRTGPDDREPSAEPGARYLRKRQPPRPMRRPDPLRPLLHQLRQEQRLRHAGRLPVLAVPGGGQPFLPRHRLVGAGGHLGRRHLGRRRRHRDDGAGALVGHVRHAGRDRQGRPHVGARTTPTPSPATATGELRLRGANQTHVRCAAENADVQLGQAPRRGCRATTKRRRRDAGRAHRRPRRHVREGLHGKTTDGASDSNWYYDANVYDGGVSTTSRTTHPSPALQPLIDDGQHPVLLPVDRDRGVAHQPLRRRQ